MGGKRLYVGRRRKGAQQCAPTKDARGRRIKQSPGLYPIPKGIASSFRGLAPRNDNNGEEQLIDVLGKSGGGTR